MGQPKEPSRVCAQYFIHTAVLLCLSMFKGSQEEDNSEHR